MKFLNWLAVSPLASAVKVGVAAALTFLIDNVANLGLEPQVQALAIAVLTVAINAVNPEDVRYGVKDKTFFEEDEAGDV